MGRYDHLFRLNGGMIGFGNGSNHFPHKGILINMQPLGNKRKKLQRMELRLIRKFHRTRHLKRQRQPFAKIRLISDLLQRFQFLFDLFAAVNRINKMIFPLIITIHFAA